MDERTNLTEPDGPDGRRRSRRHLLVGGSLAAVATGATLASGSRAEAAGPGVAWVCGGNAGINTDGTNYLGTKNVAPLVFKTAATNNSPLERMRILPNGNVGVGSPNATARLDARHPASGLRGEATGSAGSAFGVRGVTKNGSGVDGQASGGGTGVTGSGVYGVTGSGSSVGVSGSGSTYGVYGGGDTGIKGFAESTGVVGDGLNYGVYAIGNSGVGAYGSGALGVYGGDATGHGFGVVGEGATGVFGSGSLAAVFIGGAALQASGSSTGAYTESPTRCIEAQATGDGGEGIAVFGDTRRSTASAFKYAGYFVGDVAVFGTLSKSAGSFKIDHPLDPTNKWLSHSFVESPDMMNVYNGNVVLAADGTATVTLPDYFTALNRDVRYQLTCIGAHAPVYVATKVTKNAFVIAGGEPGLEVSWQVTGIRQDSYAKAHPILVEEAKTGRARGALAFGSGAGSVHPTPGEGPGRSSRPELPDPGAGVAPDRDGRRGAATGGQDGEGASTSLG